MNARRGPDGLSPREFETMVFRVRLGSRLLIPVAMGISHYSVSNYLHTVHLKLGAISDAHAAAILYAGNEDFREAVHDLKLWAINARPEGD